MHILLVEDNEDVRLATQGLLESAGHSVEAAVDAEEALPMLAAPSAPLEAVVTDVVLPGMSGTDLLRRLIAGGSSLPLVVVSSLQRFEALEELDASGRVMFLRKPFSAAQLERALAEAEVRAKRPMPFPLMPTPSPAWETGASSPAFASSASRGSVLGVPVWGMPLLVVLLMGMGLVWRVCSAPPPLPSAPITSVQRGDRILLDEPRGEISQLPAELRWTPVEDARSYRVILTTVDDTVLWQEVVATSSAPLPRAVAESLERAVVYHWQVEALNGQGLTVARSERVRFLLRLEPRIPSPAPGGAL